MAGHALWVVGFRATVVWLLGGALTITSAVAKVTPPMPGYRNLTQSAGPCWARSATVNQRLPSPGAGRPWKSSSVYYKIVLYLENSIPPETRHLLLIGSKLKRDMKLDRTFSAGAGQITVPPSAA